MKKSKPKIGPTLLKLFLLCLGIGFAIFCSMILNQIIEDFEFIGLTALLMFSLMAFMGLYFGISSLRTVIVDSQRKNVEIVYLWFWRTTVTEAEITGFKSYAFTNNIGIYSGILVQLKNGKQFQLSEFDTKNFTAIRDAMSSFIENKNELKLNIWTSLNKAVFVYAGMFIVLLVVGKILEW
ncbi:MAG: hypothetical protein OEZ47_14555 [Gammaproteobacteria bacterium]|nr:hypothetical protein [Gammaproteobacteria bacterium]